MPEARHTPGPWVVDDPNDTLVAKMVGGVYEYVASCTVDDFSAMERPQAEEIANAHLIAAAPDLLAACKAAWASHCDSTGCDLSWIGLMQAAIIKAEAHTEAVPE